MNYIGLPRSGKTSFRRRIMGEILNILMAIGLGEKVQPSTGVAEAGGQVFIRNKTCADVGTIASKVWSGLEDLEEEAGMLGQVLYQVANMNPQSSDETPADTRSSKTSRRGGLAALKHSLLKALSAVSRSKSSKDDSLSTTNEELDEIFSTIHQAMNAEDWDAVKYLLDDLVLLISTDTGGQAEFLDLHSSLVQGPSLNLLFSRLVDELESQFEVYYTNEEGESTDKEMSILTTEEVLYQCLSSIAGYGGTFSEDDGNGSSGKASAEAAAGELHSTKTASKGASNLRQKTCQSKALFVGTHRDKVTDAEFQRKDKLLQKKIKGTPFYDRDIIEYAAKNQLMFPVDNWSGEQAEIDRIRQLLEKIIEKSFEEITIPAAWLVLSLQIRCKKLRTMSLVECEELAGRVGISPSELQDALWFLHYRVGVLLYYPQLQTLKDTVICDLQVVYDSATNLIKNTFTFDRVGQRVSEQFRAKGRFTLEDVEAATCSYTDDLIPLQKLVQLLEYLGILTAVPPSSAGQQPAYFMPCVLRSARPSELSFPNTPSDPAPLMLRYDCGYTPLGVFPSMITNVVSQHQQDWEILEDGLRKNRVQFLVGKHNDTVTLISRPRYFEIVISRRDESHSPTEFLCSHVRGVIQSTLGIVTSRNRFSMKYRLGFECPAHPGREHLCVLREESASRVQCLEDRQYLPLGSREAVWFAQCRRLQGDGGVPTLREFISFPTATGKNNLAQSIGTSYTDFGIMLLEDENGDRTEAIVREFRDRAADINREIFRLWVKGTGIKPVSWATLGGALQDIGLHSLARDIKQVKCHPLPDH